MYIGVNGANPASAALPYILSYPPFTLSVASIQYWEHDEYADLPVVTYVARTEVRLSTGGPISWGAVELVAFPDNDWSFLGLPFFTSIGGYHSFP